MFYVYILQSIKDGTFYKGLTNDIDRRLKEHFQGECPSTKNKLPLKLVHVELTENRVKAREMEKYFKSGIGREIIHQIVSEQV